jgi:hypothetical protein
MLASRLIQLNQKSMKLSFALLTAIGVAGLAQYASAADITGTVTLSGTPPAEREITPLNNDAVCGKLNGGKVTTSFFVVGADKGLADVIVELKGVSAKLADASAAPVVMDQKGCLYTPQIVAVQTGQKLIVKNSDPASVPMHNVHINPTAGPNMEAFATKISQPQMSGGADLTYDFTAPENFMKFQCDVHPWMFAWVTVVDNPYFAVTDKSGKFTIKNVPAGKYKIVALHRKAAPTGMEKDVDVSAGNASVDFALEVK